MCPCSRSRQPSVATALRQVPAPIDDLAWRLLKDSRQTPRFTPLRLGFRLASASILVGRMRFFIVINLSAALTSSLACATLLGVTHFKTLSQLQTQRHQAFPDEPVLWARTNRFQTRLVESQSLYPVVTEVCRLRGSRFRHALGVIRFRLPKTLRFGVESLASIPRRSSSCERVRWRIAQIAL